MAIIPQTQSFKLFGAGASIGATSITLQTFKNLNGTNLTMAHFGGTKGFLTIEPSSGSQEEQVSFASITNNANGTVTLGTIKTVLDYTPFTETNGLAKTHGGNVEVIVSNTSGFYNNIIDGATASQIINVPAGSIAATNVQTAINELATEKVGLAGTETITGQKTFTETVMPRITATHTYVPGEELFLTTKDYVDNVAGSAVIANASTTVKGIVEEATDAEVLASTTTGGTGARLCVNPGSVGNAANKIPFVTSNGKLNTTIIPNLKFGGTGVDGALSSSSGPTNIDLGGVQVFYKNFTSISITGTAAYTFTNPHPNGTTVIFKSQGNVTITTSAARAIDLRLLGSSGGNAGSGTGRGGRGAGALYIECAGALNYTGAIDASGENAVANGGTTSACGGNGGGAGGTVVILANSITSNTGVITVTGGTSTSATGGSAGAGPIGNYGTKAQGLQGQFAGGRGGDNTPPDSTSVFGVLPSLLTFSCKYIPLMPGSGGGGGSANYHDFGNQDGSPGIGLGGSNTGVAIAGLNTEFV